MTHLLPGGGVPRVHGARSSVPPRLLLFATPRSVCHLATVAAGAYPPRRPPNAWSPGVPAPPGPCYWLVASGTPFGWRRDCLAAGLVRGSVHQYCLGGCSALFLCAWRSPPAWGFGPVRVYVYSPPPPSRPTFPALRVAGPPVQVSLTIARWYAIPCGLCVPRAWSGCPSGIPCVPFVCVCARALAVSVPFLPPLVCVARAPRVVPVQGAGRAVPCGLYPSAFPASVCCAVWLVFWGGAARPRSSCAWLWVVCPLAGRPVRPGQSGVGGGGGRPPLGRRRGAPRGRGSLYLSPSLCLPWAGTKAGVIGVAQFMEGVASILLRFVFAC